MKTTVRLLVTSGNGPAECRIAVRHVLVRLTTEAQSANIDFDVVERGDRHGPASAVIALHGAGVEALSRRWTGTIQWTAKSQVRPQHRRQNWFVGVVQLDTLVQVDGALDASGVRFEAFRAGGPGGQHQNTTDSAVRATHIPTGLTAIARDQRSQHRNKAAALDRLKAQMDAQQMLSEAASKKDENRSHHALERGNPVRRFKGEKFIEL